MAKAVAGVSQQRRGMDPRTAHVGFLVDKVVLDSGVPKGGG